MSRVFSEELVNSVAKEMKVADLANATIGDVLLVASRLEELTGIPFIRMDQGSPGLPANKIGIEAEKKALDRGVGSQYPAAAGVAELKQAASRFVKAFIDIDISPRACLPTTGSVAASFGAFIACTQRIPGKNKVLFIDPGFPIQKSQLRILGIEWELFDIHDFRGEPLRAKLESFLSKGDIAAVVYSNPNNPAWICLEESELKIVGELATKYDVIVLEDQAYFCMDFRHAFGRPYQPPFVPTVARYTDNYILMLSASKIFSYAGERIAMVAISDKLYAREYPQLRARYGIGHFGDNFSLTFIYVNSSGTSHTAQCAFAAMLGAAADGMYDFVDNMREYGRRAARVKDAFRANGFHLVYDKDLDEEVSDGFFFTVGYPGKTGSELLLGLLRCGVCAITLTSTRSTREGIRVCVSLMKSEDDFVRLERGLERFRELFGTA